MKSFFGFLVLLVFAAVHLSGAPPGWAFSSTPDPLLVPGKDAQGSSPAGESAVLTVVSEVDYDILAHNFQPFALVSTRAADLTEGFLAEVDYDILDRNQELFGQFGPPLLQALAWDYPVEVVYVAIMPYVFGQSDVMTEGVSVSGTRALIRVQVIKVAVEAAQWAQYARPTQAKVFAVFRNYVSSVSV